MHHFSNEVRTFADSRETSYEIAQALFDLFPGREGDVWAEPTDAERAATEARAWEMADTDETSLCWGQETVRRDA